MFSLYLKLQLLQTIKFRYHNRSLLYHRFYCNSVFHSVSFIQCLSFSVFHSVSFIKCLSFSVFHSVSFIQCLSFSVFHSVSFIQCLSFSVFHSVSFIQCLSFGNIIQNKQMSQSDSLIMPLPLNWPLRRMAFCTG